jgi:hypothetical protein
MRQSHPQETYKLKQSFLAVTVKQPSIAHRKKLRPMKKPKTLRIQSTEHRFALHLLTVAFCILFVTNLASAQPPFGSDPIPKLSVGTEASIVKKDLNGYPNYGRDGACDVLYYTNQLKWTFDLAALGFSPSDYHRVEIHLALVLDDHYSSLNAYAIHLDLPGNSQDLALKEIGVQHGTNYGSVFANWKQLSYSYSTLPSSFSITARNTSSLAGNPTFPDWIAIDKIEIVGLRAAAPVITAQPSDTIVNTNDHAFFSVEAAGAVPLSYQWQFRTVNMLDATNSLVTFAHASLTNVGWYQVVVSNLFGVAISRRATLGIIGVAEAAGPPQNLRVISN